MSRLPLLYVSACFAFSFRTVTATANLGWDGSEVRIRSTTYSGSITLSRRVRLTAQGGPVRIGH